jgi:hypothetical protein
VVEAEVAEEEEIKAVTVDNSKKGLCAALGSHVFDYGDKGSADQLRVSWEKLCNHVGTLYGQDISTKLCTGTTVHIPKP